MHTHWSLYLKWLFRVHLLHSETKWTSFHSDQSCSQFILSSRWGSTSRLLVFFWFGLSSCCLFPPELITSRIPMNFRRLSIGELISSYNHLCVTSNMCFPLFCALNLFLQGLFSIWSQSWLRIGLRKPAETWCLLSVSSSLHASQMRCLKWINSTVMLFSFILGCDSECLI